MKHLKTYEARELTYPKVIPVIYNTGDYVKIKIIPDYAKDIDPDDKNNLFVKIIRKDSPGKVNLIKTTEFRVNDTFIFELSDGKFLYGNQFFIDRRMTKKEIQEYELRKAANKYNL